VKEKTLKWDNEKKAISAVHQIKEQIEKTKQMMKEAEREVNYSRLAELQYGEMARLENELKKEDEKLTDLQKNEKMLKEEVDEEDVAEVVSKWTGVPVSKMLEGEVEKLIHMEERLRQRVGGSGRCHPCRLQCREKGEGGIAGSQSAHRFFYLYGSNRCGKDRVGSSPGGVFIR